MPEVKNFCPATGVGRFDAKLEGSELDIKIKLHVATALDDEKERAFRSRFEPLVKQHWEGQYGFSCANTAYPQTYRPVFAIDYTDQLLDAHFVLNLIEGAGGTENIGRDAHFKVPKTHTGFAPTTAQLYTGSLLATNSSGDLLRDLASSFPLYVDMAGIQPSRHAATQMKLLARQLARVEPGKSVMVTAYGTNRGTKQAAVIQMLTQCGLTNVSARSSKRHFSKSFSRATRATDYVKVSISGALDVAQFDVTRQPLFTYPAAAVHEFGHMLGLMDEYACMSKKAADKLLELHFVDQSEQQQWQSFNPNAAPTASISARVDEGQKDFIDYCAQARVEPPHFGMHTISVMSSGSNFEPCHFVTLWASIVEMTKGITQPGDWSIVKL